MRAKKAESITFLLSGFLIVGGFVMLSVNLVIFNPQWQPLFGFTAVITIVVSSLTYIRELMNNVEKED